MPETRQKKMSTAPAAATHSGLVAERGAALVDRLETAKWTFAKTMPESPHWYTMVKSWSIKADFYDTVQGIRDLGRNTRFKGVTYRTWDANGWHYWSMGAAIKDTILINRATSKYPGAEYDPIADRYDRLYANLEEESRAAFAMADILPSHRALDVGCGTGIAHDVGIDCSEYVGIEPSAKMIRQARVKHPTVAGFRQCSLQDTYYYQEFDRILLMFGTPNHIPPPHLDRLYSMLRPGGKIFMMWYAPGYQPICNALAPKITLFDSPSNLSAWRGKFLIAETDVSLRV